MLELKKNDAGDLELIPTDLKALKSVDTISDALDDALCNGWTMIFPDDIGALTVADMISDDASRDDDGKMTVHGEIYWDMAYETRDTLAELQAGNTVVWWAAKVGEKQKP